ncbi:MAG: alpha/beta hydrolase [Myxococcota bacterium]
MRLPLLFLLSCTPVHDPPGDHCDASESVQLDTPDGARIALHRHKSQGPPVVVIHGIASNHNSWDLQEDRSLAVALEEQGFDAWLLDLRGHGDAINDKNGERQRHGWSIDDYGKSDLSTAIDYIRTSTGQDKVAVVGHSMGGMVAAAYHGHHGDDHIAALVVVGSPIDFDNPNFMYHLSQVGFGIGTAFRSFGMQKYAHHLGALNGVIPVHGEYLLFNPRNMQPSIRKKMMRQIVSPVSREELQHVETILRKRSFTSTDETMNYAEALNTLDVPFLAISGAADNVVPPERVEAWTSLISSTDVQYIEASAAAGFRHNYGHVDLVIGDHVKEEILEPIVDWLTERKDAW